MKVGLGKDARSAEHPQQQKVGRPSNTRKKFCTANNACVVIVICLVWRVGPVCEVKAQPAVPPAPHPVPLPAPNPVPHPVPQPVPPQALTLAADGSQQVVPLPSPPFKMNAILVFPSPFLYHMPYLPGQHPPGATAPLPAPKGSQDSNRMGIKSQSKSHKTVEKTTLVKVFTDDWDDLETCPSWCKKKDGSLHCCPDKNHHAGSCPRLRDVCVVKGEEYKLKVHYCSSDKFCLDTHKCCFDRCVQARICRPAVE